MRKKMNLEKKLNKEKYDTAEDGDTTSFINAVSLEEYCPEIVEVSTSIIVKKTSNGKVIKLCVQLIGHDPNPLLMCLIQMVVFFIYFGSRENR